MLARYLEGKANRNETELILSRLHTDSELADTLRIILDTDKSMQMSHYRFIPVARLAAANDKNTCSWDCETEILRRHGISFDTWTLLQQAKVNKWLRSEGTPLHNVGRVLETSGLNVARRYNATVGRLAEALRSGSDVIVVIDKNRNTVREDAAHRSAVNFHAVTVTEISDDLTQISCRDSDNCYTLTADEFNKVWAPSRNYMVTAAENSSYDPQPIDVRDTELPAELVDLVEAIAENAHDVWARARFDEGWRYGDSRDDKLMTHPDLVEYFRLPEKEKEYDRIMAMNTLRLIQAMGFIIQDSRDDVQCPECFSYCHSESNFCPHCGKKLH